MTEKQKQLPEGWAWKTYNDIAELIRGVSYKKIDSCGQELEGFIPILRANNINQNLIFDDLVYVPENLIKDIQIVLENDIIIAMSSGSKHLVGKAAQAKSNLTMAFGAFCANLRIKKDKGVDPKYVFFFYSSRENINRISGSSSGSNINNLKREHILNAPVPLAPVKQQKQTVAKIEELFSHIDAGIESLKTAKHKLKQYRQSVLKAAVTGELTKDWREQNANAERGCSNVAGGTTPGATKIEPANLLLKRIQTERRQRWEQQKLSEFQAKGKPPKNDKWKEKYQEPDNRYIDEIFPTPKGWKWVSLDLIIFDIKSGKSFKCEERPPLDGEIGIIKVSAVTWGEFDSSQSKTIVDPNKINLDYLINTGDFLFSRANTIELVGACLIVKKVDKTLLLSDKILRFKVSEEMKEWLKYWLRTTYGRTEIESLSTGNQDSMRNISQGSIRKIRIPIPNDTEQLEIVHRVQEKLTSANRLMAELDTKLTQAQQQKQTILTSAFIGRLI